MALIDLKGKDIITTQELSVDQINALLKLSFEMKDKRYQFQPWYVKAYRQFRYTPYACIMWLWTYLMYPQRKLDKNEMSRHLMAGLIFQINRNKLEHWYTIEEALWCLF